MSECFLIFGMCVYMCVSWLSSLRFKLGYLTVSSLWNVVLPIAFPTVYSHTYTEIVFSLTNLSVYQISLHLLRQFCLRFPSLPAISMVIQYASGLAFFSALETGLTKLDCIILRVPRRNLAASRMVILTYLSCKYFCSRSTGICSTAQVLTTFLLANLEFGWSLKSWLMPWIILYLFLTKNSIKPFLFTYSSWDKLLHLCTARRFFDHFCGDFYQKWPHEYSFH